jgi:drug/metabolite transporter superfamily protein YnfA
MTLEYRRLSGILLVVFPTVIFGGASVLTLLVGDPRYMQNPLRQNLWRAGHAHAGVLLVLSLLVLRYVDEARLSEELKRFVRYAIPGAAILLPLAFFLSVLSPDATEPNVMIYLAYVGGVLLASALVTLGIGILRSPRADMDVVCDRGRAA